MRPEFTFVAFESCGCIRGWAVDDRLGREAAERWRVDGFRVERLAHDAIKALRGAFTSSTCPHTKE
jgi:hypothetical protein